MPFNIRLRSTTMMMLLGVGSVLLIGCIFVLAEVYARRSDSAPIRAVASMLPAARVGQRIISYDDFLASRDSLRVYLSSDLARTEGNDQPLTPELERNALDRLIREAIIANLAQDKGITLPHEDVQAAFDLLVSSAGTSKPTLPEYLKTSFGWSESTFRDKVLAPTLLEERVAHIFTSSTNPEELRSAVDDYVQAQLKQPAVKVYLKF